MQYLEKLACYIKKRRLYLGESLNQFCIECEIETSALSRFENNLQSMKIPNLIKIANRFGQTLAEFLTDFEKENDVKKCE